MPQSQERPDAFANALEQLRIAAEHLKLDDGMHRLLREPKKVIRVTFPVRMDNGKTRIFKGYRVQYNDARGRSRAASDTTRRSPSTR